MAGQKPACRIFHTSKALYFPSILTGYVKFECQSCALTELASQPIQQRETTLSQATGYLLKDEPHEADKIDSIPPRGADAELGRHISSVVRKRGQGHGPSLQIGRL